MRTVHPSAVVEAGALLGEGCVVGPLSVVSAGARLGVGSRIGAHVTIGGGVTLGDRVEVFPGAHLGGMPQTKPGCESPGGLVIGADTVIRECVTLNVSTSPDRATTIGKRCLLMAYVHVGHDSSVGDDVILANGATLAGYVTVEHHAAISALVPVHQFTRVGAYSYVGGGFRAVQDVPPYLLAAGEPLKPHGPNTVGLRRNGFDDDAMRRIKELYRLFYRSGLNTTQALEKAAELPASAERETFLEFIRSSTRGII